jgi:hypothetical protein
MELELPPKHSMDKSQVKAFQDLVVGLMREQGATLRDLFPALRAAGKQFRVEKKASKAKKVPVTPVA